MGHGDRPSVDSACVSPSPASGLEMSRSRSGLTTAREAPASCTRSPGPPSPWPAAGASVMSQRQPRHGPAADGSSSAHHSLVPSPAAVDKHSACPQGSCPGGSEFSVTCPLPWRKSPPTNLRTGLPAMYKAATVDTQGHSRTLGILGAPWGCRGRSPRRALSSAWWVEEAGGPGQEPDRRGSQRWE